jgi:formylglycine-generating enzyme required for sulfatase activity
MKKCLSLGLAVLLTVIVAGGCRAPAPTLCDGEGCVGDTWVRPKDETTMVYVPGGTFQMGSDESDPLADADEFPRHEVTVDGFWMGQTEVTNAQFAAFLNEAGDRAENGAKFIELEKGYCRIERAEEEYRSRPAAANYAVVMVSWYGANAYCGWVGGRLPTEAEWEYAARGAEGRLYPWGDDAPTCERAHRSACATCAKAVGQLPEGASWCGVLDMAGNAWEWVADRYGEYPAEKQVNPTGPTSSGLQIARGGGWHANAKELRTTYRLESGAGSCVGCIGFRCAYDNAP